MGFKTTGRDNIPRGENGRMRLEKRTEDRILVHQCLEVEFMEEEEEAGKKQSMRSEENHKNVISQKPREKTSKVEWVRREGKGPGCI